MKKLIIGASSAILLLVLGFFVAKNFIFESGTNYDLSHEKLGGISLNENINDYNVDLLEEVPVDHIKYQKIYIYDNKVELGVNDKGLIKKVSTDMYYNGEPDRLNYKNIKTQNDIEIGDEPETVLEKYQEECFTGREMGMGDYYRYKDKNAEITFWYRSEIDGIHNITLEEL